MKTLTELIAELKLTKQLAEKRQGEYYEGKSDGCEYAIDQLEALVAANTSVLDYLVEQRKGEHNGYQTLELAQKDPRSRNGIIERTTISITEVHETIIKTDKP